jgi:stage IV sporulation protein FB
MAAINLIIGLFNIMPVFSLDGGRALESLLLQKLPNEKCEKIITAVSVVFLVPMTFFGFYILIKSGYNFTFLAISIYLSVMLFIKNSK